MGFLDLLKGKNKDNQNIKASTMVFITDIGKKTAEKQISKGETFAILSALNEKSPSSVSEIAEETDIDIIELKSRLKEMAKSDVGLVRVMSMGS